MVDDLACVTDKEDRVVKRAVAGLASFLIQAADSREVIFPGGLAKWCQVTAIDVYRIFQ